MKGATKKMTYCFPWQCTHSAECSFNIWSTTKKMWESVFKQQESDRLLYLHRRTYYWCLINLDENISHSMTFLHVFPFGYEGMIWDLLFLFISSSCLRAFEEGVADQFVEFQVTQFRPSVLLSHYWAFQDDNWLWEIWHVREWPWTSGTLKSSYLHIIIHLILHRSSSVSKKSNVTGSAVILHFLCPTCFDSFLTVCPSARPSVHYLRQP